MNAKAEKQEVEQEEDINMHEFLETIADSKKPVVVLEVNGEKVDVEIYRVTAVQLYNVVDLLKGAIQTLGLTNFQELQTIANIMNDPQKAIGLFMENYERALALVDGLCNLEKSAINALEFDQLILLIMAEWRVNEHFFTTKVAGLLNNLLPTETN